MALADTAQLAVKLTLDDRGFSGPLKRVQSNLTGLNKSFGKVGSGVGKLGSGLLRVGAVAATVAGTALIGATKVALDFQDAMAGVSKTVEGTPDQIAAIGRQLLDLSTTIPVSATDLANIAQELGALGVPRDDIAGTAKVVAELAAATVGLTPEGAAEAFGKLGNVLSIHGPDVERFGSALVALGNAGASSEGDIIQVATRFGAAGSVAKLSAAQVLGFSSAIASLGVEPEAAGSSLSRLFNNVTKYIGTGNKKIQSFAKVSGLSVKEFSSYFAKDATGAMELFLQKLGKLDRFKAAAALKAAGITNVRDINAVLLLSQHYDELKRQVDLSTDAWKKNTDLSETAAKRFSSVQSKVTELWNTLKRAAIVMGNEFLPALGRSITRLTDLLKLPSTDKDLEGLGRDIAGALDSINWEAVIGGAKTFFGIVQTLVGLLSKIPPEIDAAVVAFAGVNKLSGGLIGQGVGDILGGLGSAAARGVAAKTPGLGALFSQPVYITGAAPGVFSGLGGGAGGVPGAAGAAGLGLVGGTIALTGVAAALIGVGELIRQQLHPTTSGALSQSFTPAETALYHTGQATVEQIMASRQATVAAISTTGTENEAIRQAINIGFRTDVAGALDRTRQTIIGRSDRDHATQTTLAARATAQSTSLELLRQSMLAKQSTANALLNRIAAKPTTFKAYVTVPVRITNTGTSYRITATSMAGGGTAGSFTRKVL